MAKTHRWQKTAMAAATAALLGLCGTQAAALSLGRITVQSSLGEPLRAEIEVPDINPEEAASLKASVALPEVFRAAGLEYNPAMTSLKVSFQRRTDGRAFIRISSDRAINEPFVDMIIEANWSTGRIVRDYTMLFDPPSLRQAPSPVPTSAQVPVQNNASKPVPIAATHTQPTATKPAPVSKTPQKVAVSPAPLRKPSAETSQVTVKPGDTASKIATLGKPANVSLDQMLVALLRANPTVFIGDNVNRIKAGSVIDMPTTEQAEATPAAEAAQIIVAQSKDFNDFRRKLAGSAPSTQVATADRKVSGMVQTQVEDTKTAVATPDKLTLSKGAIKGQAAEDQLAKDRSAKESASRAAEIAKNIADLSKLGAASTAASPGPAASAPVLEISSITAASGNPLPAASTPAFASSAPVQAASAAASSPAPTASAVVKKKVPVAVPVLPPEPSFLEELLENPLLPAGAAGLIALLAGFGFYRFRQRKNASQVDSAFLESRLQPDSFFGASGGQSVDTTDQAVSGSSMVYSPSQLDAVDDVDPVAEADVYLAYGRDLQAEEILKDALRDHPERLAIHQKLLEIYAKRNDTKSFENVAKQAFGLTSGNGADWDRICELGMSIDPDNALYQPGGQPRSQDTPPLSPAPLDYPASLDTIASQPTATLSEETAGPDSELDLDLDLDFSLEEAPSNATADAVAPTEESPAEALDLDFELATEPIEPYSPPPQNSDSSHDIEFTLPDIDLELGEEPATPQTPSPPLDDEFKLQAANSFGETGPVPLDLDEPEAAPSQDLSMLDFDLGSLSLELEEPTTPDSNAEVAAHEDPLGTKLALAEEFRAIGDDDGARALIEEVIAEATGDMKLKAQRALNSL